MPNIRNKSNQYLFKNKFKRGEQSKIKLIRESFFMMLFGLFILLLNYLIPQKLELFNSFTTNILEIFNNFAEILYYLLEILIVLLICFSLLFSIFLMTGSIIRIFKVLLKKSRKYRIRTNLNRLH